MFARLLDAPGGMRIDTIHAFCQSVLRRFPIEAGVAPHFTVLDERSAAEVLLQARAEILERRDLADALGEIAGHTGEGGFDELIVAVTSARAKLEPLLADGVEDWRRRLRALLRLEPGETPDSVIAAASHDFDEAWSAAPRLRCSTASGSPIATAAKKSSTGSRCRQIVHRGSTRTSSVT